MSPFARNCHPLPIRYKSRDSHVYSRPGHLPRELSASMTLRPIFVVDQINCGTKTRFEHKFQEGCELFAWSIQVPGHDIGDGGQTIGWERVAFAGDYDVEETFYEGRTTSALESIIVARVVPQLWERETAAAIPIAVSRRRGRPTYRLLIYNGGFV